MDTVEDLRVYRKEMSLKLIAKHKDIIDKTFDVIDMDILDAEIQKGKESDKEQSEAKFLNKIKNRKVALQQVEDSIDKMEQLERHLEDPENKTGETPSSNVEKSHPSKRFSKKD